ncbi:hypothetical protein BHE74_00021601 [Ensete ventricosum]|nr:hypothetical protein BHE74_00021601 [Ensete ventricosum]
MGRACVNGSVRWETDGEDGGEGGGAIGGRGVALRRWESLSRGIIKGPTSGDDSIMGPPMDPCRSTVRMLQCAYVTNLPLLFCYSSRQAIEGVEVAHLSLIVEASYGRK